MAEKQQPEMCYECKVRPVRHADGKGMYCQICFDALVGEGIREYVAEMDAEEAKTK